MTQGWTVGVNGLKMRAALYDSRLDCGSERVKNESCIV